MEEVEENQEMKKVEQNAPEKEEEEELELGLSLGAKKFTTCNATSSKSTCRILTAKDFHPAEIGGPTSSASSSSSSAVGSGGTKRAKPGPTSPEGAGGSSQPPSTQMVVGWPPVKTFRMNSLFNLSKDTTDQNTTKISNIASGLNGEKNKDKEHIKEEEKKLGSRTTSSPFVKVKMDGDPIGRKIDLRALASYNALASALELMFQKPGLGSSITKLKLLEESSEYKLTYEDKEGDWMLVGDVPWRMFVDAVKRLRIMRHCDDHALTPKFCSSNLSKKLCYAKDYQTQ